MITNLNPYPAYKYSGMSWLGQVPEHWETCRLKSRLVKNDSGIWRDHHDPNGTIILRSTEQTVSGGWKIENPARVHLSHMEREAYLLRAGDLVVTKSSGSADHIGKTSLVTEDVATLRCAFSNFMQRLRLGENTDPKLLWYYLNSPIGREQLVFQSTTTTGLANLNGKILANCVIALPPLPEQTAIVRFLDWADRRIRRVIRVRQRRINLLEEYKQALIHQAVTGKIDVRTGKPYPAYKDSGVEWLGQVPAHWEVRRLGSVTQILNGATPSTSKSEYWDGSIVWITPDDLGKLKSRYIDNSSRTITSEGYTACGTTLAPAGSIAMSTRAPIGHLGILQVAACVNQGCRLLVPQPTTVTEYLYYSLVVGRPNLEVLGQGSTFMELSRAKLGAFSIPCPSLPEQTAIVEYLDAQTAKIDTAISVSRREIDLLREYREKLISDVVTGKMDVREVTAQLPEEPAEEEEPLRAEDAEVVADEETDNNEETADAEEAC